MKDGAETKAPTANSVSLSNQVPSELLISMFRRIRLDHRSMRQLERVSRILGNSICRRGLPGGPSRAITLRS